ncbi:MAG: hypothetical protein AABW47_03495 [Nanoarchaeota archaeon]
MKKTRGKKGKASSHAHSSKKSNKPIASFFKKYFPVFLVVGVLLLAVILLNVTNSTGNAVTGNVAVEGGAVASGDNKDTSGGFVNDVKVTVKEGTWEETWSFLSGRGMFVRVFMWIFGAPVNYSAESKVSLASAGIITIAVWLLLFITFSDILVTFSTFSKGVSWGIGFLITLIAANLGFVIKTVVILTGAFSFLGSIAVFVGLGAAFLAFLGANIGLARLGILILKNKSVKDAATAEAGGQEIAGVLKGIGAIGEGLRTVKNKKQDRS